MVIPPALPPRPLDCERNEEVGDEGIQDRLRDPAADLTHPQRPGARGLDARAHPLLQDLTTERSLGRLEVEPKQMLVFTRHAHVSLCLRHQIGDKLSIRRRLRLDP